MSITVTDPQFLAAISQLTGVVELRDPQGNVLGELSLEDNGRLPPGVKSPFSEEEMAERRKQRDGRPLSDILRDLRSRQ
jgi:hypothetical protein